MPHTVDPQWYKKIWTRDMHDQSWVEQTEHEVNFVVAALQLAGRQRILDLACGFGRHALELARRGYHVVCVDITSGYIEEARELAGKGHLEAEFVCADLRDVVFEEEFDVVLNLHDGAVGYLEDEKENLKIFDVIASALKPGGKHLVGLCNAAYARQQFPRRHWEMGSRCLSLADFAWDGESKRMAYTAYAFKQGQVLQMPNEPDSRSSIRLYDLEELHAILAARGMTIEQAYGGYDTGICASDERRDLVVYARKVAR